MATEEVEQELEAMEAVYGPDCTIFQLFPPNLSVAMKPRTADDLSVQFVEAVLVIQAGDEYPDVPPHLRLKDAKGLGDKKHAKLLADLRAQAIEISGGPMLVAICEAATDLLTNMNFPEGDCCFCMNPLVMDDGAQPFMKLMSCFHCFHSYCFGGWWRWLQEQQQQQPTRPSVNPVRLEETVGDEQSIQRTGSSGQRNSTLTQELLVHCPVCRMVINAEDVAHVRDYLTSQKDMKTLRKDEDTKVPMSILNEAELARRSQFIAEFEAQQGRGGIIENKKLEVIQPGMIVPPRTPPLEEATPEEDHEEGQASMVINREGSAASSVSSSESSTQAQGADTSQRTRTHVHPGAGLQGGRSHRGRLAGRSYRGRRGGGFRANWGFQGRSGIGKDMGTSEPSRLQSQEPRHFERAVVNEAGLEKNDPE